MAAGGLHKKLGPLEAWQWGAIAGGTIVIYYVYEHEKNASASSSTSTAPSSTDSSGAIDPTTGLPYANEGLGVGGGLIGGGGSAGTADTGAAAGTSTDSGTTLSGELSDLGSIETLLDNLEGIPTTDTNATLNSDLTKLNSTLGKQTTALKNLQKQVAKKPAKKKAPTKKPPRKTTKPGGTKNPGHHITTHANGQKTASSSAPHNSQQHRNIAPPSHQRAPAHPRKPARRH